MWEIVSSDGLGHRWPFPNSWDKGDGEEEVYYKFYIGISLLFSLAFLILKL